MRRQPLLWTFASLLLMTLAAPASSSDAPWSPGDFLLAEEIKEIAVARDGSTAVWVHESAEKVGDEEKRVSNLWLGRLAEGDSFPLTQGADGASSPVLSPDGRHVAFLSDRKVPDASKKAELGDTQVWLLSLKGGEARPLTRFDQSVQDLAWRDDGTLLVLAPESPSAYLEERKEEKDKAYAVDDPRHKPPVRVFIVPLDGPVRRLTLNEDWISTVAVAPDGSSAVLLADQDLKYTFDQKVPPKTFLLDPETGERREILEGSGLLPGGPRWAPDSSGFYFTNEHTTHPKYRTASILELYFFDLGTGEAEKVDLGWPRGTSRTYVATESGVLALLEDGVRYRPALLARSGSGWRRQDLEGEHAKHLNDWAASADGSRLVYLSSSATDPPQLFTANLERDRITGEKQLSKLNPGYEDKPTGRVEVIRWKGALGEEVEGLLHFPLDWKEGSDPRPLVVYIHGGPAAADRDRWSQRWTSPPLLFRQRGAFVFQPNYHGSSGYGLEWVESIAGRYYELETEDILSGVDMLVEQGLVDPERLGCTGWSNGGILTAELITRTDRFKAASVGAADVEWISDWANVDFGAAFDNYYFGGTPWERTEHYLEKSPFFRLPEVTTPTIVYTGTEDRNVPPHQSWSLFRALQYHEKTETRLVIFPGEPHGLRKVPHQRRKIEEEMAWFDRHLFGTKTAEPAALKDDSPLAAKLAREKASRRGGSLGTQEGDHLIPEVVPSPAGDGLLVGRFEVTRAQLASFAPAGRITAATGDLPATEVTFEEAQRYVKWLATLTGRPFRLPTEKEARALAKKAGSGGNTLSRWAGYDPNPEDAEALREAAKALEGPAPLLLPVGSLSGAGDPAVFDLDGNAAEWAVAEDGTGIAVGPSADYPADERSPETTNDPAYIGLRVVVGES